MVRRRLIWLLVCAISLVGVSVVPPQNAAASPRAVQTGSGLVRGVSVDHIEQFLGVPFAEADRFAPPRSPGRWGGVRTADRHGPQCPQKTPGPVPLPNSIPFPSSEDCLSIDLYVPAGTTSQDKLPVMVYLFGGAYVLGSTFQYDSPADLVRRGRVIVAIPNYRVGPFGFLSLPELARQNGGVSGTLGTADQQAALRWVRDNIGEFGGDSGNVTLFGESAGGMSVCTQIASPGSRGLFRRAIIQSGACARSPLVPPTRESGYERSIAYASSLGCRTPSTRLSCLRKLPVDRLLESPTTGFDSAKTTWGPFIDGVIVTKTPEEALREGAARSMPLIIGSNAEEGDIFVALFEYMKGRNPTEGGFRSMVRDLYPDKADAVLAAYPVERYPSPALAMSAVYTDSLFACPAQTTSEAAIEGGARVWQYRFAAAPLGRPHPLVPRSFHGAELTYLFSRLGGVPIPWAGPSRELALQLRDQWAGFARNGSPEAAGLPDWTPTQVGSPHYLSISDSGSAMRSDFGRLHQCDLWADPPR